MPPAVSVVIATYNYGRYLGDALDSVLAQTFANWEAVVVDDGSTDNTPDVVRPYLKDVRVRYERTENRGQAAAENLGIRLGRGRLVAFLDSDDAWYPEKLERQTALFDTDPDLGVAYTRRLLMDEGGRVIESWQPTFHRGHVLEQLFEDNFISFSTSMVRREVFDRVGLLDERIALVTDWDLWLRVARYFRFDYIDEVLGLHRTGHASLARRREEMVLTALGIRRRFLEEHGGQELFDAGTIRRCFANTKANMAYAARDRSRCVALGWYLRALATYPGCAKVWKGIAGLMLPTRAKDILRRAGGGGG